MNRAIGGKAVPSVGLGCMGMSEFYGAADDAESLQTLIRAYEIGYRHFDTADMYGLGHNEKLLGKFVRELANERDKIVISTKVGIVRDEGNKYSLSVNGGRNYVRKSCHESLKRLGTDHIDLYYLHRRDPKTSLEETMTALSKLRQEGKIGSIGMCEVSADTLRAAHAIHPVAAVQSEYSLWTRDLELEILPLCRQLNIALVAFSPLGRGFLTGGISKESMKSANPELDLRTKLPRFTGDNIDANLQLVDRLKQISASVNLKPSQVALAWVLAKGDNVHVIPGTKRSAYLVENFSSTDVVLGSNIIVQLDSLFTHDAVRGARYPQDILVRSNN